MSIWYYRHIVFIQMVAAHQVVAALKYMLAAHSVHAKKKAA